MNVKTHQTAIPHRSGLASMTGDQGEPVESSNSEMASERFQDLSDAELLNAHTQHRCSEAFREIVLRYGPMVLGVCRRILVQNDLVEDAFQDTFVILANHGDRIRQPALLASWLYGVARRICMESQRKQRKETGRFVSLPSEIMSHYPEPAAASKMADTSIEVALRDAIDQLPDTYRAPIILCYFMGESHASAAQALGIPAGSISTKLKIGKEKLRNKLKRMGFVLPIVAITWLLSQMRLEAQVPEKLIASTLAKSASFSNVAGRKYAMLKLADMSSSPHLFLRYLVVAMLALSALATAEACFVLPMFRANPVEVDVLENPVSQNIFPVGRCCEE